MWCALPVCCPRVGENASETGMSIRFINIFCVLAFIKIHPSRFYALAIIRPLLNHRTFTLVFLASRQMNGALGMIKTWSCGCCRQSWRLNLSSARHSVARRSNYYYYYYSPHPGIPVSTSSINAIMIYTQSVSTCLLAGHYPFRLYGVGALKQSGMACVENLTLLSFRDLLMRHMYEAKTVQKAEEYIKDWSVMVNSITRCCWKFWRILLDDEKQEVGSFLIHLMQIDSLVAFLRNEFVLLNWKKLSRMLYVWH